MKVGSSQQERKKTAVMPFQRDNGSLLLESNGINCFELSDCRNQNDILEFNGFGFPIPFFCSCVVFFSLKEDPFLWRERKRNSEKIGQRRVFILFLIEKLKT